MRLKGKACVVRAAGQGIGAATAQAFAREGATVWATDVDEGKLAALKGVEGVQARKLDVLDKAAIAAATIVTVIAMAARPLAAPAEPALKPNQPTHNSDAPTTE